jgi:carboxylesterase type B
VSAGAISVSGLVSSQLARGSFDKFILESRAWGDSERGSMETFDAARQQGALLPKVLNILIVAQLRAILAQEIVNVASNNQLTGAASLPPYSVSIDNYVLLAATGTLWETSQQALLPMMAGWNNDEGYTFAPTALPYTSEIYLH